jgi:multisubunit Na+/H+ antiporter MnhC subunit
MEIGLWTLSDGRAILFTLGVFGIFLNRKNVIIILMSIELMLLAVNLNLVAFSSLPQRHGRSGLRAAGADGGRAKRPSALPSSSSSSATAAPSPWKTST